MQESKKEHPAIKSNMHPRNKHRERYDFKLLIETCPELAQYVALNRYNDESIDFSNAEAVKMLNKALLKHYYDISNWDIPEGYLCPPIPGRADYIHHIADVLRSSFFGNIPTGEHFTCLDIGVGANCVYPIIGNKEYGWSFIGADIDPQAIESASKIIASNPTLTDKVELRLQIKPRDIFYGIIEKDERIDLSVCNPPFHVSKADALAGTLRKLSNLNGAKVTKPVLNFGGQSNELWCEGGEERFIRDLIRQSKNFGSSCFWFSTLISKQSNLKRAYDALERAGAVEIKTIPMGQGNKISRILAWSFLSKEEKKNWIKTRWSKTVNSDE